MGRGVDVGASGVAVWVGVGVGVLVGVLDAVAVCDGVADAVAVCVAVALGGGVSVRVAVGAIVRVGRAKTVGRTAPSVGVGAVGGAVGGRKVIVGTGPGPPPTGVTNANNAKPST